MADERALIREDEVFMRESKEICLDRNTYVWDGNRWYHARTFVTPPTVAVLKLDSLLLQALEEEDHTISDVDSLLTRAHQAGEALQHKRVVTIAQRILKLDPSHNDAATLLCSSLRAQNLPAQALKATQAMKDSDNAPLLVSRAAALCDLEKWQDAQNEIKRARAAGAGKLATQIARRIKIQGGKTNDREKP